MRSGGLIQADGSYKKPYIEIQHPIYISMGKIEQSPQKVIIIQRDKVSMKLVKQCGTKGTQISQEHHRKTQCSRE